MTAESDTNTQDVLRELSTHLPVFSHWEGDQIFPYSQNRRFGTAKLALPIIPRQITNGDRVWISLTHVTDPDCDIEDVVIYFADQVFDRPDEAFIYSPSGYDRIKGREKEPINKAKDLQLRAHEKYFYTPQPRFVYPHKEFNGISFNATRQTAYRWECTDSGKNRKFVEVNTRIAIPDFILSESKFIKAGEKEVREMGLRGGGSVWLEAFRSYFYDGETIIYSDYGKGVLIKKYMGGPKMGNPRPETDKFPSTLTDAEMIIVKRK